MENLKIRVNPRLLVKQDCRNLKIETDDGQVMIEFADMADFAAAIAMVMARILEDYKQS
jgi:hypothetical protein